MVIFYYTVLSLLFSSFLPICLRCMHSFVISLPHVNAFGHVSHHIFSLNLLIVSHFFISFRPIRRSFGLRHHRLRKLCEGQELGQRVAKNGQTICSRMSLGAVCINAVVFRLAMTSSSPLQETRAILRKIARSKYLQPRITREAWGQFIFPPARRRTKARMTCFWTSASA
jgi:hypothetical protein